MRPNLILLDLSLGALTLLVARTLCDINKTNRSFLHNPLPLYADREGQVLTIRHDLIRTVENSLARTKNIFINMGKRQHAN